MSKMSKFLATVVFVTSSCISRIKSWEQPTYRYQLNIYLTTKNSVNPRQMPIFSRFQSWEGICLPLSLNSLSLNRDETNASEWLVSVWHTQAIYHFAIFLSLSRVSELLLSALIFQHHIQRPGVPQRFHNAFASRNGCLPAQIINRNCVSLTGRLASLGSQIYLIWCVVCSTPLLEWFIKATTHAPMVVYR